jgi:uncharacterized LabA/DUF88 family protein
VSKRVAFFVDGEYLTKARWETRQPTAAEVLAYIQTRQADEAVRGLDLYRIFVYDTPACDRRVKRPISGRDHHLCEADQARARRERLQALALSPDVALRRGEADFRGWRIRPSAVKRHCESGGTLTDDDFAPDLVQKGVDIRLALDLAMVAIKRQADVAVLIAGDVDFVPAMKLARREGLRVYLDLVSGGGREVMREHADLVFDHLPKPGAWLPTHTFGEVLAMGPLIEQPPADGSVVESVEVEGRTWWWRLSNNAAPISAELRQSLIEATRTVRCG